VEDSLKAFLRGYLRTYASPMSDDKTARYSAAFVDLNGDGKQEVIVYVSGRDWCGTGGCTTFIFSPKGDTYRVVAEISVRHTPIRVLKSTSHGWHSISAFVRGETVIVGQSLVTEPNYEAESPLRWHDLRLGSFGGSRPAGDWKNDGRSRDL
jgi:hypothetical protein